MMPTRGTRTFVVLRLTVHALVGIGVLVGVMLAGRPVGEPALDWLQFSTTCATGRVLRRAGPRF